MAEGIEIGELLARADAGLDALLLDVRNEEEFAAWKFEARRPVETLNVPYFGFIEDPEAAIAALPAGRDLVVLCAKGGSSEMVADLLTEAGRKARNVTGGMVAYGDHLEVRRVPTDPADDVEIWQLDRRGKGCLSYLVRRGEDAVVVDPSRRVEFYADLARRLGCRIRLVLDTHVHADHLSGRRELAASAGASTSVFDEFPLRTIEAPGHTPDSRLHLVVGRYLLSGDTLFVASVGRPDLGGEVEGWGRELFRTLRNRIADLPDETVVLPAHYGSNAESGVDGIVSGRLGDLRRDVAEMKIRDERSFVEAMRAAVREPPAAYARIVRANLGTESPTDEQRIEWELGRNQCALASKAGAGRGT